MAELSTIARPYAQGLWKALADRGDTAQAAEIEQSLFALSSAVPNRRLPNSCPILR